MADLVVAAACLCDASCFSSMLETKFHVCYDFNKYFDLILLGCEQNYKDPKRKVHKPVKGVLRLEIEKHQISQADLENMSECGSATNDSVDPGDRIADSMSGKYHSNGCDDPQSSISRWNVSDAKDVLGNGANQHGNSDFNADDVSIIPYDCVDSYIYQLGLLS